MDQSSPSPKKTNLTPSSVFLRDLAARLRDGAPPGVTQDDADRLLAFADRWDDLYNILEAAARARSLPNLHNPSMG
jgi:hypothetical protein